jgi:hypothetical protein
VVDEPDDDQSAARDLRPPVRRAREQSDDIARRSQLELPIRRSHAARLAVTGFFTGQTSIAGPDAGSNYRREGRAQHQRGRHSLSGATSRRDHPDTLLDNYGVFTFNGSKTGNAYADFLLGVPDDDAGCAGTDRQRCVYQRLRADIPRHSRLTLNLGVRYDLQFRIPIRRIGEARVQSGPAVDQPDRAPRTVVPGDAGVSRGIVKTDVNNIAPRLGLAWDRTATADGGARRLRMFYGSITGRWNDGRQPALPCGSRSQRSSRCRIRAPICRVASGVPVPLRRAHRGSRCRRRCSVRRSTSSGLTYQSNLTIEREIGRAFSVSASYVGSFARNLAAAVDNNYPVLTSTATTANVNTRRPYLPGTIGAANVLSSLFAADYNGLQLSAERRGARLSGKAYYSFGRGYEDVDFQGGGLPGVQNATNLAANTAPFNDRTHTFAVKRLAAQTLDTAGWRQRDWTVWRSSPCRR